MGCKQKNCCPYAVLWHEAIAGRKKEELVSTFHSFILSKRDEDSIIIWLDNCSTQNKNWALFSFLIYIINSEEISTNTIELRYFEPGHTFMAADSFHHKVESSMKRMKNKIYDFADFVKAVQNTGKTEIKELTISDLRKWPKERMLTYGLLMT